jgi:ADP-dependent NAD(P)H-hydrate dehydratase / NAD(P)H-hydrate epimerase
MRVLSESVIAAAARDCDQAALVQRAGYAVAQFCLAEYKFASVCVLCGRGRKGAIGLVAAQALAAMAERVAILVLAPAAAALAAETARCLGAQPAIWIAAGADLAEPAAQAALGADLIIDAMVETGLHPGLRETAHAAIAAVNAASGIVVSVDLPSGMAEDGLAGAESDHVFAQGVIALIAPKPAHLLPSIGAGPISVGEIGVPPAIIASCTPLSVVTGQEIGIALPPRRFGAEEEEFGHVLIVGGWRGRAGVAALCGRAALTLGAGRVTIACPSSAAPIVAGLGASLQLEGLEETADGSIGPAARDRIEALLGGKDVVVIGPGLSSDPETEAFIRQLAEYCTVPLVLDGAGVGAVAAPTGAGIVVAPGGAGRVLILRPLEAAQLLGTGEVAGDPRAAARAIVTAGGATAVLIGGPMIVAGASGETWLSLTGGPALAKAGMREVLAGMIGAALARPAVAFPAQKTYFRDMAVAAAVYLHGLAGDLARDALHEHAVLADDVIDALPAALRDCRLQIQRGLFSLRR